MESHRFLDMLLLVNVCVFIGQLLYAFAGFYEYLEDPDLKHRRRYYELTSYRYMVKEHRQYVLMCVGTGTTIIFCAIWLWVESLFPTRMWGIDVMIPINLVLLIFVFRLMLYEWRIPLGVTSIATYLVYFSHWSPYLEVTNELIFYISELWT
jgi:hypothetical protein